MSTPGRLLQTLDPPAGGWERLRERRNEESSLFSTTALACAVAIVAIAVSLPHRDRLDLKLNSARLIGQRSEGITLRMLDNRQTVVLPSGDPNVKLYWIKSRTSARLLRLNDRKRES